MIPECRVADEQPFLEMRSLGLRSAHGAQPHRSEMSRGLLKTHHIALELAEAEHVEVPMCVLDTGSPGSLSDPEGERRRHSQ